MITEILENENVLENERELQQDGAPSHYFVPFLQTLNEKFVGKLSS